MRLSLARFHHLAGRSRWRKQKLLLELFGPSEEEVQEIKRAAEENGIQEGLIPWILTKWKKGIAAVLGVMGAAGTGAVIWEITHPPAITEEVTAGQTPPAPEVAVSPESSENLIFGEQYWGYRVKVHEGEIETLEEIVSKFNAQGTTIEMVREIDKIEGDRLQENQRLIIPVLSMSEPRVEKPRQQLLIITLGNSNVVVDVNQDGVFNDLHFPNYVEKDLEKAPPGLEVKSEILGEPGGNIKSLENYLWWVEEQHPDILILECGNNDIKVEEFWQGSPAPFEQVLGRTDSRLTEEGIKVVLVSPFRGLKREDRHYDPAKVPEVIGIMNRVAREVNEERGKELVLVVDAFSGVDPKEIIIGGELPPEKNPNYAHLNEAGQEEVGRRIAAAIAQAGWLAGE